MEIKIYPQALRHVFILFVNAPKDKWFVFSAAKTPK